MQTRPEDQVNVHNRHKRAIADHSEQIECGTSTGSSDLECDCTYRPCRTYLEKIIQRRDDTNTDKPEQTGACISLNDSLPEGVNLPLEDHDPDAVPETDLEPEGFR